MSINNRLINTGAEGCPPYILTADSYVSGSKSPISQVGSPDGIAVSPNGTKLIVNASGRLEEYTMSTPHNLASASYNRYIAVDGRAKDLCFSSTGHRLYLNRRDYTVQYNLSTPYSLLGASLQPSGSQQWNPFGEAAFDANGLSIAADGTKLFASKIESSQNKVYLQNLSTPWELSSSTGSYLQGFIGDGSYANGFSYSNDGLNLIIHADKVVQYWSLTTPFNFATATNLQNITITGGSYGVGGIDYSNGLFVYVTDDYFDVAYQISVCG
jgi:DNA-binding beta-propeller fold protein YncE